MAKEIVVKFREGGGLRRGWNRLEADHLSLDRFYSRIAAIPGAEVRRSFDLEPPKAEALATAARERRGRDLPRLDLFVRVRIPSDVDVEALLAELRDDPEIEFAADVSEPILPAVTPDYTPLQAYLDPAPVGLDVLSAHRRPGGAGAGVGICVIEFGFNPRHEDLPPVEVIYDPSHDLSQNADHGTAVLGEMASLGNQFGVTGIALDARFYFASILGGSLPTAFGRALEVLQPGDIINVSLQYSDKGPVEYVPDVFAAIEVAVANGVSVVEAAGNFATDLDTATNALGQRIWDPASPEYRDSGAVLAGAGVPMGDPYPHSKLMLSAYGRRVNCQAWGRSVVTCGFGDLHNGGPDALYTASFGATSACAPMAAGAIACMQGVLRAAGRQVLTPEQARSLLSDPRNGVSQASSPLFPAEKFHIGPMPDLERILPALVPARGRRRKSQSRRSVTSGYAVSSQAEKVDPSEGGRAMKSCSWVVALLVSLALLAPPAFAGEPAAAASVAASSLPSMPLFDKLRPEADVIYLLASSSVVFGPDPNARSEEITFVGFVTVPKWPMPGYERRLLPSGRQEIDLELTESELTGESYLLGGKVNLGEHPDLRSLGTITERAKTPAARPAAGSSNAPAPLLRPLPASGIALASNQAAAAPQQPAAAEAVRFTFPVTENLEKLMERNPYILWDDLIASELRKLLDGQRNLAGSKPRVVPPPNAQLIEWSVKVPADVATRMSAQRGVDWRGYLYQSAEVVAADLLDRQVIQASGESFNPALIPNDFVVARKVLITTAKGILYNETPVPVRGSINAIPPVKTSQTPVGVNVFHGMELPIALLDEKGEINGWFYSKAHMAFAVKPDAIQRNRVRATAELKRNGKTERVALEGPLEIHHNKDGAAVDGEVIVLALRGKSELLGGELMMIESFDDRERLSVGPLKKRDGGGADWDFDLFLEVYTPSYKLANEKPMHLAGSFGDIRSASNLAKGNLSIPMLTGVASRPFVSTRGGELLDEAGKLVAEMVRLELEITD